jgi:hypothetical protein
VGIVFMAILGCYILWHYSHQEIRHEDLHNEQRDKRIKRS